MAFYNNNGTYFGISTHPANYNVTPLRDLSTDRLHELIEAANGVLIKRKTQDRKAWIAERCDKFAKAFAKREAWRVLERNRTIVTIHNGSGKTISGMARLAPNDAYDADVGTAVAWAHAHGEQIPDFI